MSSSQVNQWQETFDKMTMAQKKGFIAQLRLQVKETKNVEYFQFLSKCIEEYNAEIVREKKKQRIISILTSVLSLVAFLVFGLVIYLFLQYKLNAKLMNDALISGSSTQITAGTIVSKKDVEIESKDITIKHESKEKTTTLVIWDFAYEDGDAIQVFIDGEPITEKVVLLNEPLKIEVPAVGTVEVTGAFDGGGGITYAVYCDLDQTTYLNSAPIEGSNQYIFQRL